MKRLLITITALFMLTGAVSAETGGGRVVLIAAGGISVRDIADPGLPRLWNLMQTGSCALMNVRTGRSSRDIDPVARPGMEPGCVSLGAGGLAVAGAESRRGAGIRRLINGVAAGEMYKSMTAWDYGSVEIVQPEIGRIIRANEAASYRAHPGSLGSALHRAGIKTAVIGNSDMPGEMHREAITIAMDDKGLVDYGYTDSANIILRDPASAYGIQTNQDCLLKAIDRVWDKSRFIVIDFGDTLRADTYAESCTDLQAIIIRRRAARSLDRFVERLFARLDLNKDTLILLSPNSRSFSEIEEEKLTPVVIKGPEFGPGTLVSPSTRRAGVVTISDIAPTVMSLLNAKPIEPVFGRPVQYVGKRNAAESLLKMNIDASEQGQRQPIMRASSIIESVIVVLVTLAAMLGVSRPLRKLASWAALIPLAITIAMLYLPLIYSGGLVGAAVWLTILTALVMLIFLVIFQEPLRAFVWLCAVVVLSLMIDLLRGAPLISTSIAGYSLIEGARYYGIGNELMGTMLGSAIIGAGLALSNWNARPQMKWIAVGVIYTLTLIFIGFPMLGVNFGGALAAVVGLGTAVLARRRKLPGWRALAAVVILMAIAVGLLVGTDIVRGGSAQTHVGRALSSTAGGMLMFAERKIALNFMLLATSLWSRLLVLSLVGTAALMWFGSRKVNRLLSAEEKAAALGTFVGVVGAFCFNDSGVLAAATCAVVLWMLAALRSLDSVQRKESRD
jgi:hypothetical protein